MTRLIHVCILSGTLFDESILNASVVHDVHNLSYHDPIFGIGAPPPPTFGRRAADVPLINIFFSP